MNTRSDVETAISTYLGPAINARASQVLGQAVVIPCIRAYPPGWVYRPETDVVVVSVRAGDVEVTRTPGRYLSPTTYLAGHTRCDVTLEVLASTAQIRDDMDAILSQVLDLPGSDRYILSQGIRLEYLRTSTPSDAMAWITAAYRSHHIIRARGQYVLTTLPVPDIEEINIDLQLAPWDVLVCGPSPYDILATDADEVLQP
jgi:hypothetical protein